MTEKILCVDDDPNILNAFRRTLRREFDITTASSGEEGLQVLIHKGPFAVVVSDQRMPGIGGIAFLARAHTLAPDTVRIMLTGDSDKQTAIDAVNEGNIFRFLSKPCPQEVLVKTLKAALHQFRLITAERELLEQTVRGSIKVLVNILGMVQPQAFSRAMRLKDLASQLAIALELPDLWQFEVAAMLAQLGYVTIPATLMEKEFAGEQLSLAEAEMLAELPAISSGLIGDIPRFDVIARMIAQAGQPTACWNAYLLEEPDHPVALGAQILRVTGEYLKLLTRGMSPGEAVDALARHPEHYLPAVVEALRRAVTMEPHGAGVEVRVEALVAGMVLDADVRTVHGEIIAGKGAEITETLRHRLLNYYHLGYLPEEITVLLPEILPTC